MATQKMASTVAAKQLIRRQLAQVLSSLPQEKLQSQSKNVLSILQQLNVYKSAKRIAFYMSMDTSEIKTLGMIEDVYTLPNTELYLPHCSRITNEDEKRYPEQTSKLIFYKLESYQQVLDLTPKGKYKLKEPTSGTDLLTSDTGLDLIVLPAVAYDKDGFRLGHGAGFYDDYIKRHLNKYGRKPYLLGIGLQEQLIENIPLEEHDEKLDGLIINDRFYGQDTL